MFNVSSKKSLLLISVIAVFFACQDTPEIVTEDDVLAQIGDLYVSTTHFENAFKEYYYRTGQVITPDDRTKAAILDNEFNTYVLSVYAADLGLDQTRESILKKETIKRRVLTEEYLNQVILKDLDVSNDELMDFYVRFNTTLRASHIYSRTQDGINKYYKRLKNGESFEVLAKEAFKNPYLAENGGDIGKFTTDELDIAFENAAFGLNIGDISFPVKTVQGYSIIKLTDRVIKPSLTEYEFNQKKDQLYSYVYKKKKELITREHIENFTNSISFNEESVSLLWLKVDANLQIMRSKDVEFITILNKDKLQLASFQEVDFTSDTFVEEYLASTVNSISLINDKESFENFLKGIFYRNYLYNSATSIGIGDQEIVEKSVEETFVSYLAELAVSELQRGIVNTPAELFNEYQANRGDYNKPLEINLARITTSTKKEAELIIDKIDQGIEFSLLVEEYSTNSQDRFTSGELGFESIKKYGFLSPKLSNLNIGDRSEVLQYQTNEFHIYKCLDRIESIPLSFYEAQPEVDAALSREKFQQIKINTLEQVKVKHNAKIDTLKLKELIIQI